MSKRTVISCVLTIAQFRLGDEVQPQFLRGSQLNLFVREKFIELWQSALISEDY